jgi:hypothetical protein
MQISGFYGPGTWAAWVITIITSWIPMMQNDYEHNLHYILYSLYTNWAAIDAIRLIAQAPRHQTDSGEVEKALAECLVASLAVVKVGVYHAILQIIMCIFKEKGQSNSHLVKIRRRVLYIGCGLLLPMALWIYTSTYPSADQDKPSVTDILHISGWTMLHASCLYLLSWGRRSRRLTQPIMLIEGTLVLSAMSTEQLSYSLLSPAGLGLQCQCYTVPCAPQNIKEWDQAFSLFVALFIFMYEYRGLLVRIAREVFQGVYDT